MAENRGYIQEKEYEEKVLQIKRVSKKTQGGDQSKFSALVVLGNKAGRLGVGLAKSRDVQSAIKKSISYANRSMVDLNISGETIPHEVKAKYGASKVLIKPAPAGSGLIAGGTVRVVLELAGVKNASAKVLGSNNKTSNVRCTIKALQKIR
ncbi:MAG TPA: 30S ribosomal protein S5 [candidate division WWE3 bacterium]|uniref:Small ribosomal subunit protein uS5 n=1 Tax=candidate division WWE3 bacterium TaxID=2053526 RepID=A0A7C1DMD0_UNCKA|nr:30S ribosomal protein S5 [candidate division WWE3 bacterium]